MAELTSGRIEEAASSDYVGHFLDGIRSLERLGMLLVVGCSSGPSRLRSRSVEPTKDSGHILGCSLPAQQSS